MTEQEAEALAIRLTRIWTPQSLSMSADVSYGNSSVELEYSAAIDTDAGLYLVVIVGDTWSTNAQNYELSNGEISLVAADDGEWHSLVANDKVPEGEQKEKVFSTQWLPFFRRGCWLSGCDVEASAHEKAEWLQGFSREEVEAWGLKM